MLKGNPFAGAGYLIRGFMLIQQKGVRRYVVIPLGINTMIFSLLIWFGQSQFTRLIEFLLPAWLDWLEWLLWPLFALSALTIVFYSFVLFGNFVAAPFNGLLAEAVERQLTGEHKTEEDGWRKIIMNLWPALVAELKKISYFILRALPLLILFFFPLVNVVAPFIWIVFSAWILALEYADYPMGNHGILFSDQRIKLQEKPLVVLGFGLAVLFLLMIPLLNFIAIPTAVAGATAMWVKEFCPKTPLITQ